jgi:glutamate formiminotransferase/formiminotetrahydrofolate cyclodeaminase
MKLVECVPNFSEGCDAKTIESIAEAISSIEGVKLLDVDPGKSTNRTVMTFVGSPQDVLEAAFQAIRRASELIDMQKHKGAHPRIGATDVCPFIPVADVTMQECIELSHRLAKRVGEELRIPVYMYAEAATNSSRQSLADIRIGEYEGLKERMELGFTPDYGPSKFNAISGATVIGARQFLIAYNVNLNTRSVKLANDIAFSIRESGRLKRDAQGEKVLDANGKTIREPGTLKEVRAVGWYIDEYQRAQISINLLNCKVTSLHHAFDEVCSQAAVRGLRVTGSEIVGLVPLQPMLEAGRHYLAKQNQCTGVSERQLIEVAVQTLGLSDVSVFDPAQKIIEYRTKTQEKLLVDRTVSAFLDELSSDSPAPGGGSVAALCGAISTSLSAMVANLSFGKKELLDKNESFNLIGEASHKLKQEFLTLVDEDTRAYNGVVAARKLPKDTPEAQKARMEAIETANIEAVKVPLQVMEKAVQAVELAFEIACNGNQNCLSDAATASLCAHTCAEAAYFNVLINLPELSNKEYAQELANTAANYLERVNGCAIQVKQLAYGKFKPKTPVQTG